MVASTPKWRSVSTSVSATRSAAFAGWPLCGRERRRSARSGSRYSPGGSGPSKRRSCELSTELSAASANGKCVASTGSVSSLPCSWSSRRGGNSGDDSSESGGASASANSASPSTGGRVEAGKAGAAALTADAVCTAARAVCRATWRPACADRRSIAPADAPVTSRQPPRMAKTARIVTPTPPVRASKTMYSRPPRTPPYSCMRSMSNEVGAGRSGPSPKRPAPNASRNAIDSVMSPVRNGRRSSRPLRASNSPPIARSPRGSSTDALPTSVSKTTETLSPTKPPSQENQNTMARKIPPARRPRPVSSPCWCSRPGGPFCARPAPFGRA